MIAVVRTVAALMVGVLISPCTAVYAGQPGDAQKPEQRLEDGLADLQQRGLRIIYSSEIVRPDMRVPTVAPGAASLRRVLDGWLAPHGLIARSGPADTVLIVKNPRVRLERPSPPPVPPVLAGDTAAPRRFEETVTVIDAEPGAARAGPPPLAVRPLVVQAMAGGFENIFRTLQTLPGVAGTDELGSRIVVRGGGPDQNLTVMDGIEVHSPFRLVVPGEDLAMVGLTSAFSVETLDRIELHPGAFDVRYGDRLSSLLVVTHRDGSDAEAIQGSVFVGIADANVILEGKLPRQLIGSWIVSARRSYLGLGAERVIDSEPPSFQDVDARASWRPRPAQRLSLAWTAARERTRPSDSTLADASRATTIVNDLMALTFESSVGARALARTVVSFSHLSDSLVADERSLDNSRGANTPESIATGGLLAYQLSRDVAVRDLALRQEFVFRPSVRHGLDLGMEAHRLHTRWAWSIDGDRSLHQPVGSSIRLGTGLPDVLDSAQDSYRIGLWAQDYWNVTDRFALQPGLRLDFSSLTGDHTISPRLGGMLNLGRSLRLDGAVRLHSQSPGYEKVYQADQFVNLSSTAVADLTSERALHVVAGLQHDFGGGLVARVDAYHKRFSDLIVGRRESDTQRLARLDAYDVPALLLDTVPTRAEITTSPVNAATGRAYGVEFYVAHSGRMAASRLTGWAAYSLARADRTAYGVTHPFDYERRHSASVAATFRISPRLDLSTTARWATGLPRTPVTGVRLALTQDTADADSDGDRAEHIPQRDPGGSPVFQPDLGDVDRINSERLPHFGRLDARLAYRPSWGGDRWAFYLDIVNVFNATNVTKIDSALVYDPLSNRPGIIERAEDQGVPFFPYFGVRFWF